MPTGEPTFNKALTTGLFYMALCQEIPAFSAFSFIRMASHRAVLADFLYAYLFFTRPVRKVPSYTWEKRHFLFAACVAKIPSSLKINAGLYTRPSQARRMRIIASFRQGYPSSPLATSV